MGKKKAKHSEFYYRLKGLNERIFTYKQIFYDKIPSYQRTYMQKQLEKKQEKQRAEREVFEKEVESMKLEKRKLKRFQSSLDVVTNLGAGNRLREKAKDLSVSSPSSPSKVGFNIRDYQEAAKLPEKKPIIPKRGPPVRYMSSSNMMPHSFRRQATQAAREPEKNNLRRGPSSSSVIASLGDNTEGAPD